LVGVRCELTALWIAMLLLFAYGDIFGFFSPGQLLAVVDQTMQPTTASLWLRQSGEDAMT
jgi:hypothetical protein